MKRLLVVDDSNFIRSRIERVYQDHAQVDVVAKASNGKVGVAYLELYKPDIVTMDLTMPEMDGIACIEKMIGERPDIRILVVSALSDKATGIAALTKGARGFLCKPFTDEQLQVALDKLIQAK
ncbi:MAG: response regulator [Oceanobacter sp.]